MGRLVSTHPAPYRLPGEGVHVLALDAWSQFVTDSMRKEAPVTIGIGVLCDVGFDNEPCVILGADDKGVHGVPPVTTNNVCGKLHDFCPLANLGASISGDISVCDGIIAEFYEQMKTRAAKRAKGGKPLQWDDLRIGIRDARRYEFRMFASEEMEGLMGISLDEWRQDANPETRRKGWAVMRAARRYFPAWIVVGGFIKDKWIIMKSSAMALTEAGGSHYCVGIGDLAAYKSLHRNQQDFYVTWPASIVHVASAMEAARRAAPRYIGKPADYLVIRPDKPMMRFPHASPLLKRWRKTGTGKMPNAPEIRAEFEAELYRHIPVNP